MPDLEGLLGRLVTGGVDFVVVGGFAAVAHGSALMTQDVDVCCYFSPENLQLLQKSLVDLHPVHRMTPKRLPLDLRPESCGALQNLYLDTDLGQLDCLSSILGVGDFATVKANSVEVVLSMGSCRILSLDTLIQAKEALGRERDKETVLQLKALQERGTHS
ncbi:nucleotidyltransferase [Planctomycetota bacterium]